MNVAVINKKGGVGKSPIAYSLAKDLKMKYVTNDTSIAEYHFKDVLKIDDFKNYKISDNEMIDFGGFIVKGITSLIGQLDKIIIPCTPKINSIMRTAETAGELSNFNENIIIVITMFKTIKEYENTISQLEQYFKFPIFPLKESLIFENVCTTGLSPRELFNENPLSKSAYKTIIEQYENLIQFIKE
ncbi:hypothetical protein BKH41_08560 [Helicobacter sp. 12S02232-10]|uniref:hypothetical protein n=1 Tax=Helicobacter sp. 12S02232-10 TaxID=1476197 RepID=UPI000BA58FFD|nr:hypothetical protein [Helicobacter sp. 12S02232-10]PAF46751.1 hypothetical protein BKH41_08560 [Helicobacter sp. 12S02232-10]